MIFHYLRIGEVRTIRYEITYPIHGKYRLSPRSPCPTLSAEIWIDVDGVDLALFGGRNLHVIAKEVAQISVRVGGSGEDGILKTNRRQGENAASPMRITRAIDKGSGAHTAHIEIDLLSPESNNACNRSKENHGQATAPKVAMGLE